MNETLNAPEQAVVTKLTNWEKQPTLLELKQNLLDAKTTHDTQMGRVNEWLDNLHVRGIAAKNLAKIPKGNSRIQPKLIRKQAEWRYASLTEPFLSTQDLFKVKPRTWEDTPAAEQNELLLNYQFSTAIDRVRFIDDYIRAAVDEGTVVVRVGWEFQEQVVEVDVPEVQFVVDPTFAPTLQQVAQLQQTSPSQFQTDVPDELKQALEMSQQNGQPIRPIVTGSHKEKQKKTVRNRPTVEVCELHNVVFDPSCKGDMDKCGFAVYSFESCLSDLKKDGRYKNIDQINIEGASPLAQPDYVPDGGVTNFNFSDKARKKFVVNEYWGFWDIDGTGMVKPIVAAWVGDVFIRMEENPFPDQAIPFVVEQYLPQRRATYGEPDGALLEDNQKVIGAVTRGMIDLMGKSANGQTGMRKDMLDATNRRKYENGQDYEFNPNVDPRAGVHMHTYPEIPQSAQIMLQMQNQDAESLTGVKSFSQGVSGNALGDVAAGVRGALDASSKRELGILRRLKNGLEKVGRKVVAMNAEFLSDVEVVRVTNEKFVEVRRDDLPGCFDLVIDISTAEEDHNKAEELSFMLQTTGNNMDPGLRNMIQAKIAKLRKMPDLAHEILTYQPQPDQFTVQKQQLELELLQAQIAESQARAAQFGSSAQLHSAKSNTEQAKAANIQSDTDQKNLDFVEQESGVKQERAKELQGAQAKANMGLKVLEHNLNATESTKDRTHDLVQQYVQNRHENTQKVAAE